MPAALGGCDTGTRLHALADGAVVGVLVHEEVAEAAGQQRAEEAANLHAGHAHGGRASVGDTLGLSHPTVQSGCGRMYSLMLSARAGIFAEQE